MQLGFPCGRLKCLETVKGGRARLVAMESLELALARVRA